MTQTKNTQNVERVRVKHITNNWIGRINDVDGNMTQVEWLKDGNGEYTSIVSWVPCDNLIKL